jgi:hypothetical protein
MNRPFSITLQGSMILVRGDLYRCDESDLRDFFVSLQPGVYVIEAREATIDPESVALWIYVVNEILTKAHQLCYATSQLAMVIEDDPRYQHVCGPVRRSVTVKKTPAQLDREVKRFIDPLREKFQARTRSRHGDVLRAIRKPPAAIVMTDRNGRETLAVVTREMSRPDEGAWRASIFWHDGPVGHVTRKTLGVIAKELAADYAPERVRIIDDAAVIKWTGTDEFAEGSRKVAEVQAWNEGKR